MTLGRCLRYLIGNIVLFLGFSFTAVGVCAFLYILVVLDAHILNGVFYPRREVEFS